LAPLTKSDAWPIIADSRCLREEGGAKSYIEKLRAHDADQRAPREVGPANSGLKWDQEFSQFVDLKHQRYRYCFQASVLGHELRRFRRETERRNPPPVEGHHADPDRLANFPLRYAPGFHGLSMVQCGSYFLGGMSFHYRLTRGNAKSMILQGI
jgi:hypothetical protein